MHNVRCRIIDRTIPELLRINSSPDRDVLARFCTALADVGIHLMEIDRACLRILEKLPEGPEYLYRVEDGEDLEICRSNKFRYCIMAYDYALYTRFLTLPRRKSIKLTLEINMPNPLNIRQLKELAECLDFGGISCLRLQGQSRYLSSEWMRAVAYARERLGVKVDVCPENGHYMASALALELGDLKGGADFVTAAFAGLGGSFGFAALEELVMALKVIRSACVQGNTRQLANLKSLYEIIAGRSIASTKPVIGQDIFMYESGIHADGIEKNPETYEPYNPEMVGLERKLVIGKHSGSKSVMNKMRELGVEDQPSNMPLIMDNIRRKSIQLKRALNDQELLGICAFQRRLTPKA